MASRLLCAVLFSLGLFTTPISGQGFAIVGGESGSGKLMSMPQYPLLLSKAVQKELKLTEEQTKKILARIQQSMGEGGGVFQMGDGKIAEGKVSITFSTPKGGAAPPAGGAIPLDPSKIRLPNLGNLSKLDEEIAKLLEQPQRDRLKELHLQQQGLTVLAQDKYAGELGLQEEQREFIKHILEENRKKTMDLVKSLREGDIAPVELGQQMKKQREATEKDIALLLTDEQKQKWEKLTGPKFDFKK